MKVCSIGARMLGAIAVCGVMVGVLSGCQTHSHTMDVRTIKEASCLESGSEQRFCSTCDYEEPVETVNKVDHQYDEGTDALPATCTVNGLKLYTCTVCGAAKTEEVKAGHTWEKTVIQEASCSSVGKTRKSCTVCGEVEETEEKKKSHLFNSDNVCIYCDAIKLTQLPANQWRVHTELSALQFQNASVSNAFVSGGGRAVMLTYWPVCADCRVVGQMSMAAPEIDYPVMKTYYCDYCGSRTTLQFRIVI